MERSVAIKKLTKLLGKDIAWRVDLKAPNEEGRIEAREKLKVVGGERDALAKQRDARMQELLQGDAKFQELRAAAKEAKDRADALLGLSHRYRFTVGTRNSMFFMIKAQGDSWEEVIRKVTADKSGS